MNVFEKLNEKPILALAPMAGYTDKAFRQICKGFGADFLYSEMVSAAALFFGKPSQKNYEESMRLASFESSERPFLVQLFGAEPEHFAKAAKLVDENIRPDGIDINFGCPQKKILKQGAGAALMADLKRSRDSVKAVLDNTGLPVSVKLRAASGDITALDFLDNLSDLKVSAAMIHGRSLARLFSGPVDAEIIKNSRNYFGGKIIANGGIKSIQDAREISTATEADGLGIGRGALGRPWLFKEIKTGHEITYQPSGIIKILLRHIGLAQRHLQDKSVLEMRKHYGFYLKNFPNASELRNNLVNANTIKEALMILDNF